MIIHVLFKTAQTVVIIPSEMWAVWIAPITTVDIEALVDGILITVQPYAESNITILTNTSLSWWRYLLNYLVRLGTTC